MAWNTACRRYIDAIQLFPLAICINGKFDKRILEPNIYHFLQQLHSQYWPHYKEDDFNKYKEVRTVLALSYRPSFRPSIRPSFRRPVLPSVISSVYPSIVFPSVYPSVFLSVYPSVLPSIRPSFRRKQIFLSTYICSELTDDRHLIFGVWRPQLAVPFHAYRVHTCPTPSSLFPTWFIFLTLSLRWIIALRKAGVYLSEH